MSLTIKKILVVLGYIYGWGSMKTFTFTCMHPHKLSGVTYCSEESGVTYCIVRKVPIRLHPNRKEYETICGFLCGSSVVNYHGNILAIMACRDSQAL